MNICKYHRFLQFYIHHIQLFIKSLQLMFDLDEKEEIYWKWLFGMDTELKDLSYQLSASKDAFDPGKFGCFDPVKMVHRPAKIHLLIFIIR
jgi:hypothetical protein